MCALKMGEFALDNVNLHILCQGVLSIMERRYGVHYHRAMTFSLQLCPIAHTMIYNLDAKVECKVETSNKNSKKSQITCIIYQVE